MSRIYVSTIDNISYIHVGKSHRTALKLISDLAARHGTEKVVTELCVVFDTTLKTSMSSDEHKQVFQIVDKGTWK